MAIIIELTTGLVESAPTAPISGTSVFGVQGEFEGTVSLLASFPGASGPVVVKQTTEQGFFGVLTPDLGVEYIIRGALASGIANGYFGA